MYQADFTKGWHQDFEPQAQPPGTYRRLLNGVRSLSGAVTSEPGQDPVLDLSGKVYLGGCELTQDLILFFLLPDGGEVGVLDASEVYTPILTTPDFNFQAAYRISAVARRNFKGDRLVYFADGLNPLRVLNLDSVPTVDIANNLKLMTSGTLPVPTWLPQVEGGGEVPTGSYQVIARQLTRSTNPTSYGISSPLLPVVEENRVVGRDQYDGALPQTPTSKALQVQFDNLDPDFPFLQVVIITYQGTANQFQAFEVGTIDLAGRTSVRFTYRGSSQHVREVNLEELVIQPVRYETALVVSQKDGILTASNLTAKPEPDFQWQTFANLVTLKYTIEEIDITDLFAGGSGDEQFADYKNELLSATRTGYRRGETYAFGLSRLYQDYQDTTAYHLPGRPFSQTNPYTREFFDLDFDGVGSLGVSQVQWANTTTKELGTYVSREDYPTSQGYPTGKVRHHVMPTLAQEPMLRTSGGRTYLRLLGVVADFTAAYPTLTEEAREELKGFHILRMKRDSVNSRILSQGIAQQHFTFLDPDLLLSPWAGHATQHNNNGVVYTPSVLGFFSPESIVTQDSNLLRGQYIRAVRQLTGNQIQQAEKRAGGTTDYGSLYYHLLLDYTAHQNLPSGGTLSSALSILPEYVSPGVSRIKATDPGSSSTLSDGVTQIRTSNSNGYLALKTSTPLTFASRSYSGKGETYYQQNGGSTDQIFINGVDLSATGRNGTVVGDTQRILYNLTISRPSQYGKVEDGQYYQVGTWNLSPTSLTQTVWGGDTFLVKWAVVTTQPAVTTLADARTLQYFWCESSLNLNYRHYLRQVGVEGDADYQQGTLPYYPKYATIWSEDVARLGLLNFSPSLGHSRGYNQQYSFQNQLLTFFPKGITEETVTDYSNRTIYSQQSVEGDQVDQYRIFLPNDYQDVPKSHGPITQTFINGGEFGWHTTQGLWRGFFNQAVTQASSAGEVYLGNGGVFPRPPLLLTDAEGGHAGCQGQWGITTLYGHFFPDAHNGKVFRLTPDWQLEDLTLQGIRTLSQQTLTLVADKPALGYGYALGWDYRLSRLLLTKNTTDGHSPNSPDSFTWSWQQDFQSWTGEHTTPSQWYLPRGLNTYRVEGIALTKQSTTTYGLPLTLTVGVNDQATVEKQFDNLVLESEITDATKGQPRQFNQTFQTLTFETATGTSGEHTLYVPVSYQDKWANYLDVTKLPASFKRGQYDIELPGNAVIDPTQDLREPTNQDLGKPFKPNLTGKWGLLTLDYLGNTTETLTLQTLRVLSRLLSR